MRARKLTTLNIPPTMFTQGGLAHPACRGADPTSGTPSQPSCRRRQQQDCWLCRSCGSARRLRGSAVGTSRRRGGGLRAVFGGGPGSGSRGKYTRHAPLCCASVDTSIFPLGFVFWERDLFPLCCLRKFWFAGLGSPCCLLLDINFMSLSSNDAGCQGKFQRTITAGTKTKRS